MKFGVIRDSNSGITDITNKHGMGALTVKAKP